MKLLIRPLVFVSSLAIFACNNGNTSSNGSDTSTTSKTDTVKADTTNAVAQNKTNPEQDFINYAVPANTKEIIWLKAGVNHGQSKSLKDHAKMMLKDHQKLDVTVSKYLSSHGNLTAPAVDTSNVVNIQNKMGKDWDKAWVDQMVNDHSDLLGKLKQSQTDVKDTSLSSIITSTIPVVESHLAMAKSLQAKMQ